MTGPKAEGASGENRCDQRAEALCADRLPIPPRYEIREALARVIEPNVNWSADEAKESWAKTFEDIGHAGNPHAALLALRAFEDGEPLRKEALRKADACLALLTDLGGDEERQSGSVAGASREGSTEPATASAWEHLANRATTLNAALAVAMSWVEAPFVDADTSEEELRKRVGLMLKDAKLAWDQCAEDARRWTRRATGAEPDAAASLKGEPPQPLPDTPSQPSGEGAECSFCWGFGTIRRDDGGLDKCRVCKGQDHDPSLTTGSDQ
jgi:hypothetical protein